MDCKMRSRALAEFDEKYKNEDWYQQAEEEFLRVYTLSIKIAVVIVTVGFIAWKFVF